MASIIATLYMFFLFRRLLFLVKTTHPETQVSTQSPTEVQTAGALSHRHDDAMSKVAQVEDIENRKIGRAHIVWPLI